LLLGASSSGYAFTGREWDSETGLFYYRARYYNPIAGRFITEDPIGLRGGTQVLALYGANRPTVVTDPSGTNILVLVLPGLIGATTPAWVLPVAAAGAAVATGILVAELLKPYLASDESEGAQDKKLTPGEIRELEKHGVDVHELKGGRKTGQFDLYKDKSGNIKIKPKGGSGPGEDTGLNINEICWKQ
jgi:RHS repeat-associated protein